MGGSCRILSVKRDLFRCVFMNDDAGLSLLTCCISISFAYITDDETRRNFFRFALCIKLLLLWFCSCDLIVLLLNLRLAAHRDCDRRTRCGG